MGSCIIFWNQSAQVDWWCSKSSLLLYILSHFAHVCTSIQSSALSWPVDTQALLVYTCVRMLGPDMTRCGPLLGPLVAFVGEWLELCAWEIAATKCPRRPLSLADEARDSLTEESADVALESVLEFLCPFLTHPWWWLFTFDPRAFIELRTCRSCQSAAVCGWGWCNSLWLDDCWARTRSSCNSDRKDVLQRGVACLTYYINTMVCSHFIMHCPKYNRWV